ncbi:MAG: hypothetical protein PUP93_16260 [Rhizonema sp. NSF051]|nr:hypothetical protein [Rhizonema sp. NSF051]
MLLPPMLVTVQRLNTIACVVVSETMTFFNTARKFLYQGHAKGGFNHTILSEANRWVGGIIALGGDREIDHLGREK